MAEATAFHLGSFEPTAFAVGYTLSVSAGAYSITGEPVANYTLKADTGSYIIDYGTGEQLLEDHILPVTTGIYTYTGNAASLDKLGLGAVLGGTYLITGNATGLYRGYPISIVPGSYSVSGKAAGTYYGRAVKLVVGNYTLTGRAAGLYRAYPLSITKGIYSVTGYGNLIYNRKLPITADAYTIFGYSGNLYRAKKIFPDTATYSLVGNTAAVRRTRIFHVYQGSYGISGYDVVSSFKKNAAIFDPLAFDSNAFATGYGSGVETGQYVIAGRNVQFRIGMPVDTGAYDVSGNTLSLLQGHKVYGNSGSYAVSGNTTGLIKTGLLPVSVGAYTYTGKAVGVYYNKAVLGATGAYNITGQVTLRQFGGIIPKGVYAISSNGVGLYNNHILNGDRGVYQKVGYSVQIDYGGNVVTGNYIITGYSVTIGRRYEVLFSKGTYTLIGRRVAMEKSGQPQLYFDSGDYSIDFKTYKTVLLKVVYVQKGAYSISGKPVEFYHNQVIKPVKGTYTYTGRPAYRHFRMDVVSGFYDFAGQEAYREVRYNPPDTGRYFFTGYNVRFNIGLPAETGTYTITGSPPVMKKTLRTPALNVSYVLNGRAVTIRKQLFIAANDALYDITYFDARLNLIREMRIVKGTYLYTGHAVEGINNQFISAQTGVFRYVGNNVFLAKANLFEFSEKDQLIIIPAEDRIIAVAA